MTKAGSQHNESRARPAEIDQRAGNAVLREIARDCRTTLQNHLRSAAQGDASSLHAVRIALMCLRTGIRFFKPIISRPDWEDLQEHAQWLGRHAGKARDLDVALARSNGAKRRVVTRWRRQRERRYETLQAALRTTRYRRFIQTLIKHSASTPSGLWSGTDRRHLNDFCTSRLERWRLKLVRYRERLKQIGPHRRHRLRLRAKRYKYALDWSLRLLKGERAILRKQIRQAQAVQNALGRLNDGATHRIQARALGLAELPRMAQLDHPRSRAKLLRETKRALQKLERLKLT